MGAIHFQNLNLNINSHKDHGPVIEEIPGLIRLYKDGHVDRLPAVPEVPSSWSPEPDVSSRDAVISQQTGVWARVYSPRRQPPHSLLIYFHGGGFCVGSAAWRCYHEFLSKLASRTGCAIVSVNYRLAPQHRLPAAYDDGLAAVKWARQQSDLNSNRIYLSGDSAGATVAYNVAAQLTAYTPPSYLKGLILIQPFFGGEARTSSEKNLTQPPKSALTLATSDCYWRLALPTGASRDHTCCNPIGKRSANLEGLRLPPILMCVSEMDILKDRNLEVCVAMRRAGKSVEVKMYARVGHAFQVLNNYSMSQVRTQEMLGDVKAFVDNCR